MATLTSNTNGVIRNCHKRMIAVYNAPEKTLHLHYGLDIPGVETPEQAEQLLTQLRLDQSPVEQLKGLISYLDTITDCQALDGRLIGWGKNLGLSPDQWPMLGQRRSIPVRHHHRLIPLTNGDRE